MPEIIRIPNGTGKFGKPRYRRVIQCVYDHCRRQGTVAEIRDCEQAHRDELARRNR